MSPSDINNESTAQENSRLVDIMMLVAGLVSAATYHTNRLRENSPQSAHATSFEKERRPVLQRLPNPSHGERPENMAVGNNENIAVLGRVLGLADDRPVPFIANLLDQSVQSYSDVLGAPGNQSAFQIAPWQR